jgi:4-hydroxy-tetrahydrodipicolinate synthase
MKFEGIYTPVITPYRDDFSIDYERLAEIVDFLVESGVHGIISAGTTGEYYAQSMQERFELMKFIKQQVKGRTCYIVGTGATRTEDALEYASAAVEVGADAILVTTPPYAIPTERENAQHALAIDEIANLPIMLYNYPDRMGAHMGEEYLDHVSGSSNFCAIKESTGDPNRLHLLAREYPNIQLSCGMDDQALEFFAWGVRSWVCAGSNFAPEIHLALYQACVLEGDFDKGRKIMSAMMPLMAMLEQGGKFIQCVKHGMSGRDLPAGPPRKPLQPLDEDGKRSLDEVISAMNTAFADIQQGKVQ